MWVGILWVGSNRQRHAALVVVQHSSRVEDHFKMGPMAVLIWATDFRRLMGPACSHCRGFTVSRGAQHSKLVDGVTLHECVRRISGITSDLNLLRHFAAHVPYIILCQLSKSSLLRTVLPKRCRVDAQMAGRPLTCRIHLAQKH